MLCVQEYNGALVAITHNPAFARSLEATHVLRVRDGRVILAPNYGLTAADFDHTAPPVPVSAGVSAGAAPSGPDGRAAPRKVERGQEAFCTHFESLHPVFLCLPGRLSSLQAAQEFTQGAKCKSSLLSACRRTEEEIERKKGRESGYTN